MSGLRGAEIEVSRLHSDKRFAQLQKLFFDLKKDYDISKEDLFETFIPASVYTNPLSALESTVRYLKEKGLTYREIGTILNRDERTIWATYSNSVKKYDKPLDTSSKTLIPASIFLDRKKGVLEALTIYLKDTLELRYSEIARLISRDQRTVWTCYKRGVAK